MKHLKVRRFLTANGASLGELTGLSRTLYVLEHEWRNNQQHVSCIPPAPTCACPHGWDNGSKVDFPKTWKLQQVPGRSDIVLHWGNYLRNTRGCPLVGMGMQVSQTLSMVNDSLRAIAFMQKEIGRNSFMLTIE